MSGTTISLTKSTESTLLSHLEKAQILELYRDKNAPKPTQRVRSFASRQSIFQKVIDQHQKLLDRWRCINKRRKRLDGESGPSLVAPKNLQKNALPDIFSEKSRSLAKSGSSPQVGETLEAEVTRDHLLRMNKIFNEAGKERGKLRIDEFRKACKELMGLDDVHIPDHDLDMIFMKVDSNCDENVDWDEFVAYMLLEYTEKTAVLLEGITIIPAVGTIIPSSHRENIIRIDCYNKGAARLDIPTDVHLDEYARYVTCSSDGIISFWDVNFIQTKEGHVQSSTAFIMDMIILPKSELLVLATSKPSLLWYNVSHTVFKKICQFIHLPGCPTTMRHYYAYDVDKLYDYIFIGDEKGSITHITISENPLLTQINPKGLRRRVSESIETIEFQDIKDGKIEHFSAKYTSEIHRQEVKAMLYLNHNDRLLSCCKETNTAMALCIRKAFDEPFIVYAYFVVNRGVTAFDYHRGINAIISGGFDTILRVWNEHITSSPALYLNGHQNPVLAVHIYPEREVVLSLGELWEIMVWDLNSQTSLQTICTKHIMADHGSRFYSATYFHQNRECLVAATHEISVYEQRRAQDKDLSLTSHEAVVAKSMYNPLFHRVVSAGWDSVIIIWDLVTCQKMMQFKAHRKKLEGSAFNDLEITTITFDPSYRRLFTGACDGCVRIWNFNNGGLLREIVDPDHGEISSICVCGERIFTGGWSQKIYMAIDKEDSDRMRPLRPSHLQDITCMSYDAASGKLATISYDGDIYIWAVGSMHLHLFFNNKIHNGKPLSPWYATNQTTRKVAQNPNDVKNLADIETAVWQENIKASQGSFATPVTEQPTTLLEKDVRKGSSTIVKNLNVQRETPRISRCTNSSLAPVGGKNASPSVCNFKRDSATSALVSKSRRKIIPTVLPPYQSPPKPPAQSPDISILGTIAEAEEHAVLVVVFIPQRANEAQTASLVTASSNGNLYFWSTHVKGGLLKQFRAVRRKDAGLVSLAVSNDGNFLVAGDTAGYWHAWQIGHFLKENDGCKPDCDARFEKWRLVSWRKNLEKVGLGQLVFGEKPANLHYVTSVLGHTDAVTSVDIVDVKWRLLVISSGPDRSVRLWSLDGSFLGIYSQKRACWNLASMQIPIWRDGSFLESKEGDNSMYLMHKVVKIPPDIRQSVSATTLHVLGARRFERVWRRVVYAMRWLVHPLVAAKKRPVMAVFDYYGTKRSTALSKTQRDNVSIDSIPYYIGKWYYKKRFHHRPLPKIVFPFAFSPSCPAFKAIPRIDFELHGDPNQIPEILDFRRRWRVPPIGDLDSNMSLFPRDKYGLEIGPMDDHHYS